jgi:hypothetical protein
MKIVLHIDSVVLEGVPAMSAKRLGEVIERELAMSLATLPAFRWTGATVDRVASPLVSTAPIDNHAGLGRGVARALQSAISSTQPSAKVSADRDGGPS